MTDPVPATSFGTLLGGRVHYEQFRTGYRTGIEPVLLAAAIPARPGQSVLEAGCGAGAALLCLAARVPGIRPTGLERDPDMAALARRNATANALTCTILETDVANAPPHAFDHAMSNPPWHDPASTRSPDPLRDAATHRDPAGLAAWITPLATCLTPKGTLTLVLPASLAGEAITLLSAASLGRTTMIPLWPRTGCPARLVLLHARRGHGPFEIHPGLTLHGPEAAYAQAAQAILHDGAPLPLTHHLQVPRHNRPPD